MNLTQHNEIYLKVTNLLFPAIEKMGSDLNSDQIYKLLSPPPKDGMGEVAFPCFPLAKALKTSPASIAQSLQSNIETDKLIDKTQCFGPYLNFFLNPEQFTNLTLNSVLNEELFKKPLTLDPPKTIIEFSQPNTHKIMHVGHMRNLCLGDAIVKMYRYAGIDTHATTFPGDVGTHVAKCLWYFEHHTDKKIPSTKKGEWLGNLYVCGSQLLEKEKGTPKEKENKDQLTEILKQLHAKDGHYYELWKETREWSIDLMKKVYDWAGVKFDSWYWESDVDAASVKLVQEYYQKGLFIKDQGAIGIDLSDEKLGFCLLLKSDGTGLYATKDLELAKRKFVDQKIEKSIYVVDNRQSLHFKQVFKTLEKMGFENAKDCYHLQYEMVELPDGAMSSRKGNVVPIQTLIDQMDQKIKEEHLKKYQGVWSVDEINETAHIVASGAIKYGMTRVDANKKIIFNLDEWLKLDGESGPYIQYVYARIQSMLAKIGDYQCTSLSELNHPLELNLIKQMNKFNDVISVCVVQNKTHPLCSYLYELSKNYNSFYAECSVIGAQTEALKFARAELSKSVAICLRKGLSLLGIKAPLKM